MSSPITRYSIFLQRVTRYFWEMANSWQLVSPAAILTGKWKRSKVFFYLRVVRQNVHTYFLHLCVLEILYVQEAEREIIFFPLREFHHVWHRKYHVCWVIFVSMVFYHSSIGCHRAFLPRCVPKVVTIFGGSLSCCSKFGGEKKINLHVLMLARREHSVFRKEWEISENAVLYTSSIYSIDSYAMVRERETFFVTSICALSLFFARQIRAAAVLSPWVIKRCVLHAYILCSHRVQMLENPRTVVYYRSIGAKCTYCLKNDNMLFLFYVTLHECGLLSRR